ncbi:carbonic anhydrase [Chitinolyticbacter meiyuanensis]|uniref:carbonic anhydrase n=1 Tax=Chitinolyticbacter meiyuanensis TaxID=682798 RepID=UPI0011E5D461|nr:carbonic anhydrase [Chitinolyticbacter meiyuanensis]
MSDADKLIGGFRRFQNKYFAGEGQLFETLKRGQNPSTLFIACSDSRVDPAIITDCDPGDIFVVRNVANLVPPYEVDGTFHGVSSAIEYAVCVLKVKQIVVLGHFACGGIRALVEGYEPQTDADFVGRWVRIAERARYQVLAPGDDPAIRLRRCEMAAIVVSLDNLLSFPFIAERVERGELELAGWYFDLEQGALYQYNRGAGAFEVLVDSLAA